MNESITIPLEERGIAESISVRPTWFAATIASGIAATTRDEALFTTINLRNALPEPFDFSDHIANTMWTVGLTGIVLGLATEEIARRKQTVDVKNGRHFYIESPDSYRQIKIKLFGAAMLTAAALNALSETKLSDNPDITDFAYGMLGGLLAYATQKPRYIKPSEAAELATELSDKNPVKSLYYGPQTNTPANSQAKNNKVKPGKPNRNHHHRKRRR